MAIPGQCNIALNEESLGWGEPIQRALEQHVNLKALYDLLTSLKLTLGLVWRIAFSPVLQYVSATHH